MEIKLNQQNLYWGLSGLTIFGAIIARVADLPNRVKFGWDLGLISIYAYKNIILHEKLLEGPLVSGFSAALPSTFYEITTFLLRITNFSYYVLPLMTIATNVLAIILMLVTLPALIGKRATLIASALYSFSSAAITYSLVGSNPLMVPPLFIIALAGTISYFKFGKSWVLPFVAFALSFMTHFHATTLFLLPGVGIVYLLGLRRVKFDLKTVAAILLSAVIVLYVGVRPHYLQNKSFGNRTINALEQTLTHGMNESSVSLTQSLYNAIKGLTNVNVWLGFPRTPYESPNFNWLGLVITLGLIGWCAHCVINDKLKPTPNLIISMLFLTYTFFQLVLPRYTLNPELDLLRWLDTIYFPLFFIIIGIIISNFLAIFRKTRPMLVVLSLLIFCYAFTNAYNWISEDRRIGPDKINLQLELTKTIIPVSKGDTVINIYGGATGSTYNWNIAFLLWKLTGQTKYLRQFIWNVDPQRNAPFYIITGKNKPETDWLQEQEDYAKSFEDYPIVEDLPVVNSYFVEKVFNNPTSVIFPSNVYNL